MKQRESLLPQVTIREERQGAPRADNVARMFGNPTSKEQLAVMKSIGDRVAEEQKKMMFSLPKLEKKEVDYSPFLNAWKWVKKEPETKLTSGELRQLDEKRQAQEQARYSFRDTSALDTSALDWTMAGTWNEPTLAEERGGVRTTPKISGEKPDELSAFEKLDENGRMAYYRALAEKPSLTAAEKEIAKQGVKELRGTWMERFQNGGIHGGEMGERWSLADRLEAKSSAAVQFAAGAVDAIPFMERGREAGKELAEKWAPETLEKTADPFKSARETGDTAYGAGTVASDVAQMVTGSSLIKGATGKIAGFSKLPGWIQNAVNNALLFSGKEGVDALSDGKTPLEAVAAAGRGLVGGAAGSAASDLVGYGGEKLLFKLGLQNRIVPEILRQGAASTAFAGGDIASTWYMTPEEERPGAEEIGSRLLTAFAFAELNAIFTTVQMTKQNRAYLENAARQMMADYERLSAGAETTAERDAAARRVMAYSDNIRKAVAQNRYVGQQKFVDKILQTVDLVDDAVRPYLAGTSTGPAGYTPVGSGSTGLQARSGAVPAPVAGAPAGSVARADTQTPAVIAQAVKTPGMQTQPGGEGTTYALPKGKDETGAFRSLKNVTPSYEELVAKPDVKVMELPRAWADISDLKALRKSMMKDETLFERPYRNADTGVEIYVAPKSLTHSYRNSGAEQVAQTKIIPQLIENAVFIGKTTPKEEDAEKPELDGTYVLLAPVWDEQTKAVRPVKLIVKEYRTEHFSMLPKFVQKMINKPDYFRSLYDSKVLVAEQIEGLPQRQRSEGAEPHSSILPTDKPSKISVSELMNLVKGDARKHLPKPGEYRSVQVREGGPVSPVNAVRTDKEAPLAGGQMGVDPLKPGLRSSGASSVISIPQRAEDINGNVRVGTSADGASASTDGMLRSAQNDRNGQNDSVGEELRQAGWTRSAYDGMQKLSRGEVPTAEEARDFLTYMQEQEYELTGEETALLRRSGLANVDEMLAALAARGKQPYTMEEARRANAFPFPEELEAKEGRNPLVAPPAADGKTLSIEDIKIEKPLYASDGSEGKLSAELRKGDVRGRIDRRIRNMQAGEKEKLFAKGVAEGVFSLEDTPRTLDRHVVEELADLYRQRAELKDTGAERARSQAIPVFDQTMYELVEETEGIKGGSTLRMWANTADRNNLRIFGEKLGAEINEALFDPIAANEAERIRFMNRELDRIRALELTDEESYWVQAVGDRTINQTLDDVPAQMRAKVKKAVELFSSIYEQYHVLANNFLVSRGYAPIGYQKGYFPHFTQEEGGIVHALKTLGMDERVTPLDTSAQGQTEFRKPGKKWNPYFLERNGVKTEIDAVKGFERYVSALSDVLYHTDDIQKLRRFEKAIRDRYSSDELSQEIEFQHDKYLNGEQSFDDFMEKRDEALRTLGNVRNLGGYAEWLLNYTNKLAGKQVTPDRAMEALFGRSTLNVGREVQDAFAKSAVFGNISTAINNIIPVVQATGEVKTGSMARAAQEYISGQLDDFIMESDFLSSRAGVDWLTMKPGKVAQKLSKPFEKMDELSTVWVTRAKYLDEINSGADHKTALKRADDFARKIVGDRSKGQKALVFEAKNPLMRLLTTFQLEVANNMAHWTQDLPREFRRIRDEKGAKEMVKQLVLWFIKGQVATFLANQFIKALTGREPVPGDVGGTIKNLYSDMRNPDMTAGDALGNLGETLVSQTPYLSNATALLGYGDGRIPVPQVDSRIFEGVKSVADGEGAGPLGEGLVYTGLGLLPGGSQLRKSWQGGQAWLEGGSYIETEDGRKLRYPVEQNLLNGVRTFAFGQYATPEAQAYIDGGFKSLSVKETEIYDAAVAAGIDRQKAFDTIKSVKGLKADKDADGNTVKSAAEKQREAIDQNAELTEEERVFFRMAILNDAQKEKAAALNAKGIDDETFIDIYDTYEKLLGTVNPAGGEKEQAQRRRQKATEFSRYLDGLYLSDAKRAAVDEAFPHSPEGYRLELMSEAAQERFPDAEAEGYTEQEYVKYYPVFTQQKKKDEILDEAVKMGMTKKEAEEFWKIVKAKKEDEKPKSTLGKPVLEEKKFVELPIFGPDGKVINR